MLLILWSFAPAAAQGRQRSADVRAEQFVDQRQPVPFVLPEGEQRFDLRGIEVGKRVGVAGHELPRSFSENQSVPSFSFLES